MKKMKRLLLLVAVFTAAALLLSSCGTAPFISYDKLLKIPAESYSQYGSAARLNLGENVSVSWLSDYFDYDGIMVLKNSSTGKYGFYNITTGWKSDLAYETGSVICDYGIILCSKLTDGEPKFGLINSKGDVLLPFIYNKGEITFSESVLVKAKGSYYQRMQDGALRRLTDGDKPSATALSHIEQITDDYVYFWQGEVPLMHVMEIKTGNIVYSYRSPRNDLIEESIFVLSNNKLVIQRRTALPYETENYSYLAGGGFVNTKYDLKTTVVDVKNGKAKDVKADYIIAECINKYDAEFDFISDSYKKHSLLYTYPVIEKILYEDESRAVQFLVNDSLGTAAEYNVSFMSALTKNRFFIMSPYGVSNIADKNGKAIFTLGSAYGFWGYSGGLILAENESGALGAFDLNGKLIIPFEYDSITGCFGNFFMAGKLVEGVYKYYRLDKSGSAVEINPGGAAMASWINGVYILRDNSEFKIYNYEGTALTEFGRAGNSISGVSFVYKDRSGTQNAALLIHCSNGDCYVAKP